MVRLVGTERIRIVAEAARLLCDPRAHAAMAAGSNPYGDGTAATRIVSILLERSPLSRPAGHRASPLDTCQAMLAR